jgi:hypothetical protein
MAKKKATGAPSPGTQPKGTGAVHTVLEALDRVGPRPQETGSAATKKNYAEKLSRHLATCIAHGLRKYFIGILPKEDGGGQESYSRSRRALKKLDVNYSTIEMGLGLGVSIKTINFRDFSNQTKKFGRFSKNYSRNDNELRAEATDYHLRQPYAVLVGILFLPIESCDDGGKGADKSASSFAAAVNYFRLRANRTSPTDDVELFEQFFVGLYHHDAAERGQTSFFDVIAHPPPKYGRPRPGQGIGYEAMLDSIRDTYDARNNPPPIYAPEPT